MNSQPPGKLSHYFRPRVKTPILQRPTTNKKTARQLNEKEVDTERISPQIVLFERYMKNNLILYFK